MKLKINQAVKKDHLNLTFIIGGKEVTETVSQSEIRELIGQLDNAVSI